MYYRLNTGLPCRIQNNGARDLLHKQLTMPMQAKQGGWPYAVKDLIAKTDPVHFSLLSSYVVNGSVMPALMAAIPSTLPAKMERSLSQNRKSSGLM
jgi:hypothetical protein